MQNMWIKIFYANMNSSQINIFHFEYLGAQGLRGPSLIYVTLVAQHYISIVLFGCYWLKKRNDIISYPYIAYITFNFHPANPYRPVLQKIEKARKKCLNYWATEKMFEQLFCLALSRAIGARVRNNTKVIPKVLHIFWTVLWTL